MAAAVDVEILEELGGLIEELTTTGRQSLDEKQFRRVKNICKTSESYVNHAYHIVMTQLKKKHAEIRLSSFQIIHELFQRSHAFREHLLSEFQVFLGLVIEIDNHHPLPPPVNTAKILKGKAVDAIESWYQKYGRHYKKLDLGYHYVRKIKHVGFDSIRSRSLVETRRTEERERKRQRILQKKIEKVENEIAEHTKHIDLCITEMTNCFTLLLPRPEDYEVHLDFEEKDTDKANPQSCSDDWEKQQDEEQEVEEKTGRISNERDEIDFVRDHGLGTRSYEININLNEMQPAVDETEDNSVVMETAREMNQEINHKYLPMVNQWLQVFSKAGHSQQRIQSIIDLKRQLKSATDKFVELNISPLKSKDSQRESESDATKDDEDDEDEFEDVPEKEGVEYIISADKRAEYGLEPLEDSNSQNVGKNIVENVSLQKNTHSDKKSFLKQFGFTLKDAEDPTSHARALLEARKHQTISNPATNQSVATATSCQATTSTRTSQEFDKRKHLLGKAPVVPFDMDLYHWEDPNYEPPKLIRSDNFNNHWASKDAEAEHIFEDDKGSMLKRTIMFGGKFEPVKWSCRALLPNGKLCPREDRIKCPFHGIVVARDDAGNPISEKNKSVALLPITSTSTSANQSETWQDLQKDIEAATGISLGEKGKKRKGRKKKNDLTDKELSRKQKYARLTDIHKSSKTAKSRLEKKVLSRDSLKRVAQDMDNLATKRYLDKFGDQFNYQLRK